MEPRQYLGAASRLEIWKMLERSTSHSGLNGMEVSFGSQDDAISFLNSFNALMESLRR